MRAYSISLVRYAGLSDTMIAPICAVAYCTSTHSATFGLQMPTRSPFATPRAINPFATLPDLVDELSICQAQLLIDGDQSLDVRMQSGCPHEIGMNSLFEQRCGRVT